MRVFSRIPLHNRAMLCLPAPVLRDAAPTDSNSAMVFPLSSIWSTIFLFVPR